MEPATYEILTADDCGFRSMSSAELANAKFTIERTAELSNERLPWGQWYCENPDCIVREVQIKAKLLEPDDKLPAELRCPVCRKGPLSFHHWLREEILLRVADEPARDEDEATFHMMEEG